MSYYGVTNRILGTHCRVHIVPDVSLIVKGFVGLIAGFSHTVFITMVKWRQKCGEILHEMVDNTKAFRYNQLNESAISGILVTLFVTFIIFGLFL
jgi:hypothetical protein